MRFIPQNPKFITDSGKINAGEKEIFDRIKKLENNKATENWIVFHGLLLKASEHHPKGEIDFLLIIPYRGIFIIEVKGGDIIAKEGKLYSGTYEIDPIGQLRKESGHIKEFLKENNLNGYPIFESVAFPDSFFKSVFPNLIQIDDRQIFDKGTTAFLDFISEVESTAPYPSKKLKNFTSEKALEMANLFVPGSFGNAVIAKEEKDSLFFERVTNMLTENEKEKFYVDNRDKRRVLVNGSGGSGKSFLATHIAEKRSEQGYKVGLFGFNIIFGNDLTKKEGLKDKYSSMETGPILEYMTEYIKSVGLKSTDFNPYKLNPKEQNNYFNKEIDELACRALEEKPLNLDYLILDESQDFFQPARFSWLSKMIKGGLSDGNWYLFGDFKNQLIFNHSVDFESVKRYLSGYSPNSKEHFDCVELQNNLRNSKKICEELSNYGVEAISPFIDEKAPGEVKYFEYKNQEDELFQVEKLISDLLEKGTKPEQITILTNKDDSIVNQIQIKGTNDYRNIEIVKYEIITNNNQIGWAKIRRFKGMENHTIIVLDVNEYKPSYENKSNINIFITALQRAKTDFLHF